MFSSFSQLQDRLRLLSPKVVAVAAAHDLHTLEAVFAAAKVLPMQYILVGDPVKIRSLAKQLGETLSSGDIVPAADNQDCAAKAVALVRQGKADVLMKGILETGTLLKAVLHKETGIRGTGTMSHLAMLESPGYHKLVAVTDGGMIPYPTLEQKADIVKNAVSFLSQLGIEAPKVAALAAVETVSDKMPETIHAAQLVELCAQGKLGSCILEGPLSFDIAVSPQSAAVKGYTGQVPGQVDILLAPNIGVGNILTKGLLYWGEAKMAGCILGAKSPIVLVSRGASWEEKLLSILLCLCGSCPQTQLDKK